MKLDTLYVDLTKYSEERIPVLKSLFHYWLDVAKWHRPSVIVFDNLERVVPAEVEVSSVSVLTPHYSPLIYVCTTSMRTRFDGVILRNISSQSSVRKL
jgi:hypothetical protein